MKHDNDLSLERAIGAVRSEAPDAEEVNASAMRVSERLSLLQNGATSTVENLAIGSCDDVRRLLGDYRRGTLTSARSLLIGAHLRECGACHRQSLNAWEGEAQGKLLDWSLPKALTDKSAKKPAMNGMPARRGFSWRSPAIAWSLAPACALAVCSFFIYRFYWQVPPGVRAEVVSIDGSAYRVSGGDGPGSGDHQLAAGDQINEGDHLRTNGGSHAVLRLADGSKVEIRERSTLEVGARGHDMTVSLDGGAVIVQAAKREVGHLYVKTPDCRVAVTGTVFSVNSGIKGSRVAVLEGSVHMTHNGQDMVIDAGGQGTTNENLDSRRGQEAIAEQISWSQDRAHYLPLMAQVATLQKKIEAIALPQARYSSDLLGRMPGDTVLYLSIPNLGDFLSQAVKIFDDQRKQSPELERWWDSGHQHNSADLDAMVEKLHQMSQYLGDEVVVVGVGGDTGSDRHQDSDDRQNINKHQGFAILSDVRKGGLEEFLKQQPLQGGELTVLDEATLRSGPEGLRSGPEDPNGHRGMYALVREHEVVFSNSLATIKEMEAHLMGPASGFADGDFGKQITAAYGRGAGVILAADLHTMMKDRKETLESKRGDHSPVQENLLEKSGIDGVQYLIAEHREINGQPANHLNLQFSGSRQKVASWLAAPAAMGSLEFVTPNASAVVSVLSKDPKLIADDILGMAAPDKQAQMDKLNTAEQMLHISLRDDIAANLGGEFLISLDGPVLPMPSWKAVIEVRDADRLEKTLEQLAQTVNQQMRGAEAHSMVIDSSEAGGQRFYAIRDASTGNVVAHYTFADGYMILAPTRALLMDALRAHSTGDSLARSASFKASLPKDENDNYSAVAYQNLSPVLTPLLSQYSGQSAETLRKLAADTKPTTACAWGRDSRIEAASDSRLFGFDFLTLGALLHPQTNHAGNNRTGPSVRN